MVHLPQRVITSAVSGDLLKKPDVLDIYTMIPNGLNVFSTDCCLFGCSFAFFQYLIFNKVIMS